MASLTHTNNEVAREFRFFRVCKDNSVEFFFPPCQIIPPSDDPTTGLRSKDVSISNDVSARLFLPKLSSRKHFPVLLYVHGGGFSMQSAFSPHYHQFCAALAAEAEVILVSVEYGLFPSRPIPACYDDTWTALQWIASHVNRTGPEPWLNDHADFESVYIGGDSAGGNISHTIAVRVGSEGLPSGVKLVGAILIHPYFGGVGEDDEMWMYMCPGNSGLDDPRMNPSVEDVGKLGCERVLMFVAEKDHLWVPGKNYYQKLKKSGFRGSVELVENLKEEHCFFLGDLQYEKAKELKDKVVSFLKN